MKIAAAIILFILSGCATPVLRLVNPTLEEVKTADYGKFPRDYGLVIGKFMLLRMYRPSGAQYVFKNAPRKKWIPGYPGPQFGYGVCADIAAPLGGDKFKKSRSYFFLINNSNVIQFHEKPVNFYCLPMKDPPKPESEKSDPKNSQKPSSDKS